MKKKENAICCPEIICHVTLISLLKIYLQVQKRTYLPRSNCLKPGVYWNPTWSRMHWFCSGKFISCNSRYTLCLGSGNFHHSEEVEFSLPKPGEQPLAQGVFQQTLLVIFVWLLLLLSKTWTRQWNQWFQCLLLKAYVIYKTTTSLMQVQSIVNLWCTT